MTRAGRLRHRLKLQEDQGTQDATGHVVASWVTIGEYWGAVEPLQGRELIDAQQIQEQWNTRIVVRYHKDFTPEKRVVHAAKDRTRTYDIKSVLNPSERNMELQLYCTEVL